MREQPKLIPIEGCGDWGSDLIGRFPGRNNSGGGSNDFGGSNLWDTGSRNGMIGYGGNIGFGDSKTPHYELTTIDWFQNIGEYGAMMWTDSKTKFEFVMGDQYAQGNGGTCPNCLDPSSIGHNLLWLTYPGGNNPLTKSGDYSYSYVPTNLAEYPAIGHDRRYDKLKIKGASGLFTDTRAIGADWTFVTEEYNLALNPSLNASVKIPSFILGTGLGLASLTKTITTLFQPGGIETINTWFQYSNQAVNNFPTIHKH